MIIRGAGWILAAWLIAAAALGAAHAQTVPAPAPAAPAAPEAPAPTLRPPAAAPRPDQATISGETRAVRSKLDAFKLDLDQKEAALAGRELSDAELQGLRRASTPSPKACACSSPTLAPKLEAAKARLEQLGPKPKEDDPEESADVARDRAERESAVAELDETQRLARAVLIQAEQLTAQVGDRRRAAFTRALFERTYSILSPDSGWRRRATFRVTSRALGIVARDTIERFARNATLGVLLLLGLAFGVAVGLCHRAALPRAAPRDARSGDPRPFAPEAPARRPRRASPRRAAGCGSAAADLWDAARHGRAAAPRAAVDAGVLASLAFVAFVHALAASDPGAGGRFLAARCRSATRRRRASRASR